MYRTGMASDMALFEHEHQNYLNTLLLRLDFDKEARGKTEDEIRSQRRRLRSILADLAEDWYQARRRRGQDESDTGSNSSNTTDEEDGSGNNTADREVEAAAPAPLEPGEFESILLRAYAEYGRRHDDQDACIHGTHTMARLAAACARLSRGGGKIVFRAEAERRFQDLTIADVLDDKEKLAWMMVQPHAWEDIHCDDDGCDDTAAKVLSRLPVALSDAGVQLTELHVGCFPHYAWRGFHSRLLPEAQQPAELELELRQAFQHLEIFSFREINMGPRWLRSNPPEADMPLLHAYLSAAVASPQLQSLCISCRAYRICTGRQGQRERYFRLTQVLPSGSNVSSLTSASLLNMQTSYSELQGFLSQLSHGLRSLTLCNITLADGRWAPLLDTLHTTFAQRCREKRCELLLACLYGGELGDGDEPLDAIHDDNFDGPSDYLWKLQLQIQQAKAYVVGKTDINPLLRTTL